MIILTVLVTGSAISGCASSASNTVVSQAPANQSEAKPSILSTWVRDRSKDYVTAESRPPIQFRNRHLAESFNEDYKIPGE